MENNKDHDVIPEKEMDQLAAKAMQAAGKETPVLAKGDIIEEAKKVVSTTESNAVDAVGNGTKRLPTLEEIEDIDRTQLVKTESEILHENVVVGEPDHNYIPPANRPDDVITDPTVARIVEAEAQMAAQREAESAQKKKAEEERKAQLQREAEEGYEGPGMVIINTKEEQKVQAENMSEESLDNVSKYLSEMESSMVASTELRQQISTHNVNLQYNPQGDPGDNGNENVRQANLRQMEEKRQKEADEAQRGSEAMILINKLEDKNKLGLTSEEHAKLKETQVINLKQVETVDLRTIKKKRDKKPDVRTAIKLKNNSFRDITVVLPISGYSATFTGCSTYEIMTLQKEEDAIQDTEVKWNLVFEKMIGNTLGIKTFEEFLNSTATDDFETCMWAITRATFSDEDVLELNCANPECTQNGERYAFEWKYRISELLRAELISDRTNISMSNIISAKTEEEALQAFRSSPLNEVIGIKLPHSGYIVEIAIRNGREFIDKTLTSLASPELKTHYQQAAALAAGVNEITIPIEGEAEGYTYDDPADIAEIIYNLKSIDLITLTEKVKEHTEDIGFTFGFVNVECPRCKNHRRVVEMNVATILFYLNARSLTTKIE